MFSTKGQRSIAVLISVAATFLLSAEQAQAQCRGGGGSSQLQSRLPQSAVLTAVLRQQQAAVLSTGPPVQPQAAMLVALQQQNALLNAALQQQQQQNLLRVQNGQRTPKRPQKARSQLFDTATQRNDVWTPDSESPGFIVFQPKQPK